MNTCVIPWMTPEETKRLLDELNSRAAADRAAKASKETAKNAATSPAEPADLSGPRTWSL